MLFVGKKRAPSETFPKTLRYSSMLSRHLSTIRAYIHQIPSEYTGIISVLLRYTVAAHTTIRRYFNPTDNERK